MALTKVTGQVINSTTDLSVGVATVGGGTSTGDLYVVGVSTFSGDVSVGGTLTYEDVTNVDAVGLITARNGISVTGGDVKVGSGITLSRDGDIFATGVCTATSFVGSGANLTSLPTQISFNNASADRVLTSNGGTAVNCEANLSMTGNILTFNTTANSHRIQNIATGDHYTELRFDSNRTSADTALAAMTYYWDGDQVADIIAQAGSDASNKDDGHLIFRTSASQGSIAEALRITSAGSIGINTANPNRRFTLYQDATTRMNLKSLANSTVGIEFGDPDDENIGYIVYDNTDNSMQFGVNAGQRLKIDTNGQVKIGSDGSTTASNFSVGASDDLKIYHTGDDSYISNSTNTGLIIRNLGNSNIVIQTQNSYPITMKTNGEERLTLGPSGDLTLKAAEGTSANLYLIADQGDDNGDGWRIGSNQDDNDLTIANNDSGSYVDIVRLIHKVGDTSTNMFVWGQGVTDNNQAQVTVKGTTTGGTDRHSQLMVAKHSNITNLASAMRWQSDDGTTRYLYMDNNVQVRLSGNFTDIGTTSGTVIGSQSSDIRLKDLVGDGSVPYGLSEINQINPIRFKYKKIGGNPDRVVIGFSAQQVKPIIPEAVYDTGEEVEGEENMLGMDYVNIIPALVNSIKELSAENTALKARLDAAGL